MNISLIPIGGLSCDYIMQVYICIVWSDDSVLIKVFFKQKLKRTRQPKLPPTTRKTPQTTHANHKQYQGKERKGEKRHSKEGMKGKERTKSSKAKLEGL